MRPFLSIPAPLRAALALARGARAAGAPGPIRRSPVRLDPASGALRIPAIPLVLGLLVAGSGCAPQFVPGGPPTAAEIPSLEAALADRPTDPSTRLRLGAAYLEADRGASAIAVLEPLTGNPPDPVALLMIGGAFEAEGELPEARASYERLVRVEGDGALRRAAEERILVVRRRQLEREVRTSLAREAQLTDRPPEPATVAVFPFQFEGSDPQYQPLGRALAEMVVTDLGRVDRIRVLERLRVQFLLDEMALAEQGRVDPVTAVRSGRLLGAETVIQGRIGGDEAQLSVLAGLVRTAEGATVRAIDEADPLQAFFDMQKRLVLGLFEGMGVQLTPVEQERVLERPTENLQALLLFGRGLEAEDRGDFQAAAALFQQAVDEDPAFEAADDRAEENRRMDRQAGVGPAAFPVVTIADLPGSPFGPPGFDQIRLEYMAIEHLLPGPEVRDPGPELLGTEGIGLNASILDIILRWP